MLRTAVVVLGVVLLAAGIGLGLWLPFIGPGVALGIWGGLILLGTLFERIRYKPLADENPGPGWADTGERFHDPETGDLVTVYSRDRDGERRYVRVSGARS